MCGGTLLEVPALEFSTLLEVTEASITHFHASCTSPTRCTPDFGVIRRVKLG